MKSRPPALAPLLLLLFLFIQCVLYSLPPPEHLTARQLLENLEKKEFKGAVMDLNFDNVDPNHIFQRFEIISGLAGGKSGCRLHQYEQERSQGNRILLGKHLYDVAAGNAGRRRLFHSRDNS